MRLFYKAKPKCKDSSLDLLHILHYLQKKNKQFCKGQVDLYMIVVL